MAQNESVPPQPQAQLGGQSERQLAQWMQLQQNRIDSELQAMRVSLTKIERGLGVLNERSVHTDRKVQEVSTAINVLSPKVDKLGNYIAIGVAVIVTAGAILGFVLGSDIAEVSKALQALSAVKDSK